MIQVKITEAKVQLSRLVRNDPLCCLLAGQAIEGALSIVSAGEIFASDGVTRIR